MNVGTTGQEELQVTTPTDRSIATERIFAAPLEKVWRAYTDPKLLAKWWGRGNRVDVDRFEFERGGHWRFVEHHDDGKDGFEGRFREIVPRKRISQTFEWDGMPGYPAIDTAIFEDLGGTTRVRTETLFFRQEERDGMMQSGMTEGMRQSYAALERVLASL